MVTIRESETPFWLGMVKVKARDTVEPAAIELKPLNSSLVDQNSYVAVDSMYVKFTPAEAEVAVRPEIA